MMTAPDAVFGRTRIWYPEVGSTMDVAASLAAHGAPHGTVVEAGHQSAGRGRQGRQWVAPPGSALLGSWIMRPPAGHDTGVLSPLVALALIRAIRTLDPTVPARYKWPNDVWIDGGKVAGILLAARYSGGAPVVIAGTGVNIVRPAHAPTDHAWLGDWIPGASPALVRDALATELDASWPVYVASGHLTAVEREALNEAMLWRDATVEVLAPSGPVRGTMAGIQPDGSLVLRPERGGEPVILRSGEIARGPRIASRTGPDGAVYFPEQGTT